MADCNLAGVCFGNLEMSTFLEEKMDVIDSRNNCLNLRNFRFGQFYQRPLLSLKAIASKSHWYHATHLILPRY